MFDMETVHKQCTEHCLMFKATLEIVLSQNISSFLEKVKTFLGYLEIKVEGCTV